MKLSLSRDAHRQAHLRYRLFQQISHFITVYFDPRSADLLPIKSNFRVQLFEDPAIDKEVEIRKKVLKIYNKRELDFSTLKEYNDYLEQVEDIVFNLTNNVDVERTKQIMEQYQRDNKDVIQRNKAKLTREQEELEELLLQEQQNSEQRRLETLQEEQRQLQAKRKNKQALLDELESSKLPAAVLLAQHKDRAAQLETQIEKQKQNVKPANIFSTGIMMPLFIDTYGPPVPELDQLGRLGYLNHVRTASPQDHAGGYTSGLACHRALQDAFSGLFPS
ncbi:CDK-activating kinase assembly factor MAT1 [Labeo rohita]|uniref:CDK-activating kinase assembly factor MAT1 n=1 Tax=Labeo rohita TaxID=84645 RepID=A0A498MKR8_LABRO|nr:CDK-activating kinase assembly factor MAT1 [Labeo rohita]